MGVPKNLEFVILKTSTLSYSAKLHSNILECFCWHSSTHPSTPTQPTLTLFHSRYCPGISSTCDWDEAAKINQSTAVMLVDVVKPLIKDHSDETTPLFRLLFEKLSVHIIFVTVHENTWYAVALKKMRVVKTSDYNSEKCPHYLQQMWFYLHFTNLTLSWNSTTNGYCGILQKMQLAPGFLKHDHVCICKWTPYHGPPQILGNSFFDDLYAEQAGDSMMFFCSPDVILCGLKVPIN